MEKLSMPPTNGAVAPYDPTQVARGWVWRRWLVRLFGGRNEGTSKKEMDKGVLAFGGQIFE
jgi:hypothetical protein